MNEKLEKEIMGNILNVYVTDNNGLMFQVSIPLDEYNSEEEALSAGKVQIEQAITSYYTSDFSTVSQ